MMRHARLLMLVCLVGAASPAYSDSRFYCSADDKAVSFTVESGFAEGDGHKLNHFRGAILIKDGSVAAGFKKRTLDSSRLVHHWLHDGELRLEVYDAAGDEAPGSELDLVVIAGQRGKKADTFPGTYELTVSGGSKPVAAEGKVSCGLK